MQVGRREAERVSENAVRKLRGNRVSGRLRVADGGSQLVFRDAEVGKKIPDPRKRDGGRECFSVRRGGGRRQDELFLRLGEGSADVIQLVCGHFIPAGTEAYSELVELCFFRVAEQSRGFHGCGESPLGQPKHQCRPEVFHAERVRRSDDDAVLNFRNCADVGGG